MLPAMSAAQQQYAVHARACNATLLTPLLRCRRCCAAAAARTCRMARPWLDSNLVLPLNGSRSDACRVIFDYWLDAAVLRQAAGQPAPSSGSDGSSGGGVSAELLAAARESAFVRDSLAASHKVQVTSAAGAAARACIAAAAVRRADCVMRVQQQQQQWLKLAGLTATPTATLRHAAAARRRTLRCARRCRRACARPRTASGGTHHQRAPCTISTSSIMQRCSKGEGQCRGDACGGTTSAAAAQLVRSSGHARGNRGRVSCKRVAVALLANMACSSSHEQGARHASRAASGPAPCENKGPAVTFEELCCLIAACQHELGEACIALASGPGCAQTRGAAREHEELHFVCTQM